MIIIQTGAKRGEEVLLIFNSTLNCLNLLHSEIGNHFSSKLAPIAFLNEDYKLAKFEVHSFSHFELQKYS